MSLDESFSNNFSLQIEDALSLINYTRQPFSGIYLFAVFMLGTKNNRKTIIAWFDWNFFYLHRLNNNKPESKNNNKYSSVLKQLVFSFNSKAYECTTLDYTTVSSHYYRLHCVYSLLYCLRLRKLRTVTTSTSKHGQLFF